MISGISEVSRYESLQKRLKLIKKRKSMLPLTDANDTSIYFREDFSDFIISIQEKLIKNRRVPQIVDIEDFKLIY
jgi:hypothetical protein